MYNKQGFKYQLIPNYLYISHLSYWILCIQCVVYHILSVQYCRYFRYWRYDSSSIANSATISDSDTNAEF